MTNFSFLIFVFMTFNSPTNETYKKIFYENGNIKAEGWTRNDKKENYWKFYYENGKTKKEGHFSNNNPTDYWYFYNSNGLKESEGHFINGNKADWWIFYDEQEKVSHKCQLKFNRKNGYCLMYENGKIVSATKYIDGKKIKAWHNLKDFKKENNLLNLR